MNGHALAEFAKRRLQLDFGETRADGKVTLEAVYCLGNCACAPSAMIDGHLRGRVDSQTIAECAAGWGVPE
jgi:formate dehydrogenase subunit gamma